MTIYYIILTFIIPVAAKKPGDNNKKCYYQEINRESRVRIKYYDENWEFHDEVFEGFKARIIQHEYDHLDGILFTDKVSPLRKRLIKGKLTAISKGNFDAEYRTILPGQKIK